MRSAVGTFCPGCLLRECLLDFLARAAAALPDAPAAEARDAPLFVGREAAPKPLSAARSSARPTTTTFLTSIESTQTKKWQALASLPITLLLSIRRYHARQEHGHNAFAIRATAPQDLECDVHSRLELGDSLAIVVNGIDRFVINLGNHVAAVELQFVGKAGRIDFRDQHAALPFHTHTRSTFWRQAVDAQPEFRR